MTIGPKFLEEMQNDYSNLSLKLSSETSVEREIDKIEVNEASFRFEMNQNEMANFKLAEGIRNFSKDVQSLSDLLSQKLRK